MNEDEAADPETDLAERIGFHNVRDVIGGFLGDPPPLEIIDPLTPSTPALLVSLLYHDLEGQS